MAIGSGGCIDAIATILAGWVGVVPIDGAGDGKVVGLGIEVTGHGSGLRLGTEVVVTGHVISLVKTGLIRLYPLGYNANRWLDIRGRCHRTSR